MTDQTFAQEHKRTDLGTQLFTTGLVSAIAAVSATLLFLHFFPQTPPPAPMKIAVVDLGKIGLSIGKASVLGLDANRLSAEAGQSLKRLSEQGYIVLDARYVVNAPDKLRIEPNQLVQGMPSIDEPLTGEILNKLRSSERQSGK